MRVIVALEGRLLLLLGAQVVVSRFLADYLGRFWLVFERLIVYCWLFKQVEKGGLVLESLVVGLVVEGPIDILWKKGVIWKGSILGVPSIVKSRITASFRRLSMALPWNITGTEVLLGVIVYTLIRGYVAVNRVSLQRLLEAPWFTFKGVYLCLGNNELRTFSLSRQILLLFLCSILL